MQALKFNLRGKTAMFKRPDVNTYCLFSYSHIHKLALLGILGAICGFKGYNQQKFFNEKKENKKQIKEFPEFYEKLKDIKVSIIPKRPTFSTKIQLFNNSVGYASKEDGGNLIVKEQWLENPSWKIFVLMEENKISEKLKHHFLSREFIYLPYLGKNDHYANIEDIELVDLKEASDFTKIDSMILGKKINKIEIDDDDDEDDEIEPFKYTERLPYALDKEDNAYIFEKFIFTNNILSLNCQKDIYSFENKNIAFF